MNPLVLLIPATLFFVLLARKSSAQSGICGTPPPSPQPQPPPGWVRYRGAVSQTATAQAISGLKNPLGTWSTFLDENGEEIGVLQQWHCHEPEEGMRPIGWHKGSTLFRRALP